MAHGHVLIDRIAKQVNADEPWKSPRAKALDRKSLVQGLQALPMSPQCRLAFLEQLQADNGIPAEQQSWLGNLAMVKGGGLGKYWTDTETHRCKGGNEQLAERFKSSLKTVHTQAPVHKILLRKDGVSVFALGHAGAFEADDVILAIPPSLWRDPKHKLTIKPPLPAAYRVQFGKNVKFLLNVQKDCWKPSGPDMSSDGPIDLTWEGTDGQPGTRAGMVSFSGAKNAEICRKWKERKKEYLRALGVVYPDLPKSSGNDRFMDWPGEEWTRGSYSFPGRGEVTRVGPLLRAPFKERLHFAGEHTCYAFVGYMEAALQSGLRIAEMLARRDGLIR